MAGPTIKSSTGHLPPMRGRSSPVLEQRLACGVLKRQCSCFLGLIETSLHLPRAVQMLKGCGLERQKKNQGEMLILLCLLEARTFQLDTHAPLFFWGSIWQP